MQWQRKCQFQVLNRYCYNCSMCLAECLSLVGRGDHLGSAMFMCKGCMMILNFRLPYFHNPQSRRKTESIRPDPVTTVASVTKSSFEISLINSFAGISSTEIASTKKSSPAKEGYIYNLVLLVCQDRTIQQDFLTVCCHICNICQNDACQTVKVDKIQRLECFGRSLAWAHLPHTYLNENRTIFSFSILIMIQLEHNRSFI